jgi:hypothetical protein
VAAWHWQIRRVLRSPAGAQESRIVAYVPNEKREWFVLIFGNVCVPVFITWFHYVRNVDTQVAMVVAISSLLILNFTVVLTVCHLRKGVKQKLPKGYISWAVVLALLSGLLAIGGAYW